MLMMLRDPRVDKKLMAYFKGGQGIIENISKSGGFLRTQNKIPDDHFNIELTIMGYKRIKIGCEPQWNNESGVGFKVLNIENSKQEFFTKYIQDQFQVLERYGNSRIFTTEKVITFKDTNLFGNVYFSNFIEYQGEIREKFFLSSFPDLNELLAKRKIRLVTIDVYNKFINSAYFGDTLLIELTTSDLNAATCKLNINFKNKTTGKLVGQGYQRLSIVNSKGKVIRVPEILRELLDFYQEVKI
jgi:enediyne biosynthesis thioesterase